MLLALEKFRVDEGGYGMAFAAFTLFSVVCFGAYTVNLADVTNMKTKMQMAADAGAYAGAVEQANLLQRIAIMNIIMAVLYALFLVGFVLWLIPWTTAIGNAIMKVCEIALKILNYAEKILAFASTFIIKNAAEDYAKQNGADTASTFAKDAIPAIIGWPPIAYMFADDDYEYMKPEDPDDTRAIEHSFAAITISQGTPYSLHDDDHTMMVLKESYFANGVNVIAMKDKGNSAILGESQVFFKNPELDTIRYGSGQNIALASGRAFCGSVKRSDIDDNYLNLLSPSWKPKLVTLKEGGATETLPLLLIKWELMLFKSLFQH
ncbi:MAG: hypothetical protein HZA54_06470 [Planctomycetes bacterium]|nr:hypothetical protein [Planctomycetota bacterium]